MNETRPANVDVLFLKVPTFSKTPAPPDYSAEPLESDHWSRPPTLRVLVALSLLGTAKHATPLGVAQLSALKTLLFAFPIFFTCIPSQLLSNPNTEDTRFDQRVFVAFGALYGHHGRRYLGRSDRNRSDCWIYRRERK